MTRPSEDPVPSRVECSIVIPTCDSGRYLRQCLDALFRTENPFSAVEVIAVDGGSVDETMAILTEHETVRVVSSPNQSISQSRNIGARAARAEILLFIDSDCLAPPHLLTVARERIREHECVGAFYVPAPHHGWVSRTWLLVEGKSPGPVDWIIGGTIAIRRRTFERVGGFDESMRVGEDVEFGHRLRRVGVQPYHEPAMACQHLGQADDLATFFRKEAWRGSSLLQGLRREGLWSRPSLFSAGVLGYTFALLLLVPAVALGLEVVATASAATLVALPALLSLRWARRRRDVRRLPAVFVLYLVHLLARTWGLLTQSW